MLLQLSVCVTDMCCEAYAENYVQATSSALEHASGASL